MDRAGRLELHYRAVDGDLPGIHQRLAAGDGVGFADRQGMTPLHLAAQQSHVEAVAALIDAGAPVNVQDQFGNTPLWRAVFDSRGRTDTVQRLLNAGANPDLVNNAGVTARELATRMGLEDVIALFGDSPI